MNPLFTNHILSVSLSPSPLQRVGHRDRRRRSGRSTHGAGLCECPRYRHPTNRVLFVCLSVCLSVCSFASHLPPSLSPPIHIRIYTHTHSQPTDIFTFFHHIRPQPPGCAHTHNTQYIIRNTLRPLHKLCLLTQGLYNNNEIKQSRARSNQTNEPPSILLLLFLPPSPFVYHNGW